MIIYNAQSIPHNRQNAEIIDMNLKTCAKDKYISNNVKEKSCMVCLTCDTNTNNSVANMNELQNFKHFPICQLILVIILSLCVISLADRNADVTFQFPEYDYKETSKNVIRFSYSLY